MPYIGSAFIMPDGQILSKMLSMPQPSTRPNIREKENQESKLTEISPGNIVKNICKAERGIFSDTIDPYKASIPKIHCRS